MEFNLVSSSFKGLMRLSLVLILVLSFAVGENTRAEELIYYVDVDATGADDGSTWADAFTDLQDGLSAAGSGDEIWVAAGTYRPTSGSDRSVAFQLRAGVGVYGGFTGDETLREQRNSDPASNNTFLSGDIGVLGDVADNSYTVVTSTLVTTTAILDGFTITAGNANGSRGLPHPERSGGGMHNDNSSPTLANLIFLSNHARWGGAMLNDSADPTIINVVFEDNHSDQAGGGIYNKTSNPALVNLAFYGNTALSGWGMYNSASDITLVNAVMVGNTADMGSAFYNTNSNPLLTNLSISGNVAATSGGGLYNDASNPVIQNVVLWEDQDGSGSSGAAQIYNVNAASPSVSHSIVQGSGGSGVGWDSNLGTDSGGNLDLDPLFNQDPDDGGDGWGTGGNDDYGDLRLGVASPAIDAGDAALLPADPTDLDGDSDLAEPLPLDLNNNPSLLGANVDIGAFEVHNEPPSISGTQSGQTMDDKSTLDLFASVVIADADDDPLTVVVSLDDPDKGILTNLAGMFVEGPPGTYTYSASPAEVTAAIQGLLFDPTENRVPVGSTETTTFTISVDDGRASTVTDDATTVEVTSSNDDPVAVDDSYESDEDVELSVIIPGVLDNDSDLDGDELTASVDTLPLTGTVSLYPDGSFVYTPPQDFFGVVTYTYTLSDGHGGADTGLVTLTLNPVNDAPLALDDGYTSLEDEAFSLGAPGVLANDDDVEGDTLLVDDWTQPDNGAVLFDPDGSFTYTSDENFFGQDVFSYTVCDDGDPILCDTAAVTMTVEASPVNDPPLAVDDSAVTGEDTPVTLDVLDNDLDPDGDLLLVDEVSTPAHGSLEYDPAGPVTYTPDENFFGQDSFSYTVCDDGDPVLCDTGEVTIAVEAGLVNDPPLAVDDSAVTGEDAPVTLDVLDNDLDPDGDNLLVDGVSMPAHGSLEYDPAGPVTYTPDENFFGQDSFTYTVCDDGVPQECSQGAVEISVASVNDPPTAGDDAYTTDEDTVLIVPAPGVLANDHDLENDSLSVSTLDPPAVGTLSLDPSGSFTYSPPQDFYGQVSFTYTVSDGNGGTDTASVVIDVLKVEYWMYFPIISPK